MKKTISLILILILCLSVCAGLSGCSHPTVSVMSMLEIDGSFAGTRTVSVIYPLSVKIDALKDRIIGDDPTGGIDGVDFTYGGVESDGYYFTLSMSFSDKEEYEKEVAALIGRSTSVFLSRKNTYLTNGTRMKEDFDVSELIGWIVKDTSEDSDTKKLSFSYDNNTVSIGSDTYSTSSTTVINECSGSAVESVDVKTTNNKNGRYDRTISFVIPNSTYSMDQDAVKAYFLANTLPEAQYAGWARQGSDMVYTAIYENLNVTKLIEVTARLLDTDSVEIYYGDRDNASTPLAEGLTFEENLDTFSFLGANGGFPVLNYSYSLPLNTTYGAGTVFEGGRWVTAGDWQNDMYSVQLKNGSARLRIPDGIQYQIAGIDFTLESLGESRFRRSTDFLYAKDGGQEGADYAVSYFESKGVAAELRENNDKITCHVAFEGTTDEITKKLVSVFGSGNFLAYDKHKGLFDLSIKTDLTDYVDLSAMLSGANAECPMTYYVSSDGGDNIVSVSVDGSETAYTRHSKSSLTIKNGCAVVRCHGNIPVTSAIVLYLILGAVLLILTAFVAIKLIQPKRPLFATPRQRSVPDERPAFEPEEEEEIEPDPELRSKITQTTTFSIFELNTLVKNKKYVDEINKDVEARMRAQSLEEQKKDIRQRDLKEMSRKVYGSEDDEEDFVNVPKVEAVAEEEDFTEVPEVVESTEEPEGFLRVPSITEEEPEAVELPEVSEPSEDPEPEEDEEEDSTGGKWYD